MAEKNQQWGSKYNVPANWDEARVIEINSAWENRGRDLKGRDNNMWQGISIKSGVLIRGYKSQE